MKIAEINMCADGSTGKIMLNIAEVSRARGHQTLTFSTNRFSLKYSKPPIPPCGHKYFGSYLSNFFHYAVASRIGFNGCFSALSTRKLISQLKKFSPDILHLHNLHEFCINLPLLFKYIKSHKVSVVWTLHDCWAFTGHCPHFDMIGCEKWKSGCYDCPQYTSYPRSSRDDSKTMYRLKKKWFGNLNRLTLVTPSLWLKHQVEESFLKNYPVFVINNGIDLTVFAPTVSSFKEKNGCKDKKIILGVASGWGERKGLDVFVELSKRFDDNYQIVLVGVDEKLKETLPENIITLPKTQSQTELAGIYSAADVFVNPTREETFPTVNIEALACGTPVVTFNTGGSAEIIDDSCGIVVEKNNVEALKEKICEVAVRETFSAEACRNRALQFDMYGKFKQYVELYEIFVDEGDR